ncbi:MAG TPA: RIP metalloprotease RseP [Balneolaceae bacterium]|nr:RIP metalloprotease RseP [Balneolaceae bacterium]
MSWIVEVLTTIGIFAGALFILVFSHELGHFLAAKFFGMRVERFSLGFPPTIFSVQKGETEYAIGATPLGGYVKISGMLDESMDTEQLQQEPKPWEFRSKPVWQRMIVISAGVVFNMILAILIFAGIGLFYGQQKIPTQNVSGIYVPDSSIVHKVGFRTGDKLIAVNGHHPKYFSKFTSPDELTKSKLTYTVERNGQRVNLTMPDSLLDEIKGKSFIGPQNLLMPSKISSVMSGSPADTAGLKAGDKIVAVNGEPVKYWQQLVQHIKSAHGTIQLTVERSANQKSPTKAGSSQKTSPQTSNNTRRFELNVKPNKQGIIGIRAENMADVFHVEHIKYGFFGSIGFGVQQTVDRCVGILQGFQKMFSGAISVRKNLGGPVAIANITRQATENGGWLGFWNITAFLSITLAIMNILPIPVLDGGHIVFLLYEGITRREPSEKVRMALQQIGFLIIIAIFILVTFNDILRLF